MNRLDSFAENLFSRQRWLVHLLFWIVVLTVYAIFFGRKNSNYEQTFFFVGLLMPVTIGTTYFLNYYLVPEYLLKSKYGIFALYFFYTLLGSLVLEMMIAFFTFLIMAGMKMSNMSPASIDIFFLLASLLMVVFFSLAIKLLLHWKQSKEEYQKLMWDKAETELKFLKSQLNPHFLFNTLNNLYFLANEKSDKAPKAILALSEILDYVLRAGKTQHVPLQDELKQVDNYIALEMLRYEGRVDVQTNFSGDFSRYQIPPMILITLVENAFKHGVMPAVAKGWITISIQASDTLAVMITNSFKNGSQGNGIGLKNLTSQLDHLYKRNYDLQVVSAENIFTVTLILKNEI